MERTGATKRLDCSEVAGALPVHRAAAEMILRRVALAAGACSDAGAEPLLSEEDAALGALALAMGRVHCPAIARSFGLPEERVAGAARRVASLLCRDAR